MGGANTELSGPNFGTGVSIADVPDGAPVLGHANGEAVLVVRKGEETFAIGATCTHYGGPLAEGLLVEDTLRCPWHHACFSLRTGEALRPPALNPVVCWRVERYGNRIVVHEKRMAAPKSAPLSAAGIPGSVVIVGGGAAANSAAETMRHEGYAGRITMLS